ncbi:helix-turn-helix domain-containing protein [Leifsonia xyli]|uniref:helix-turn-helix domain-containing protein n=1 Tax=Leifsonia xyli TaxID=1575 RepID=UPI0009D7218F
MDTEEAVTPVQLARHLNCSVDKVLRMAKTKEIPSFRIGRLWRFFPEQVDVTFLRDPDPWAQSNQSRSRRRST